MKLADAVLPLVGYVERITEGTAYIRLTMPSGTCFEGTCDARILNEANVPEGRRFTCRINGDEVVIERVPDELIGEFEEQSMDEATRQAFGD
jgi:hypothetical protein